MDGLLEPVLCFNNQSHGYKVLMIFIINNFIYEFIQGPQKVKYGKVGFSENVITAKNIIIATGSVPFVPKGIEVDGKHPFLLIPILPL